MDEERRLLHVALTRARVSCTVSRWGGGLSSGDSRVAPLPLHNLLKQ